VRWPRSYLYNNTGLCGDLVHVGNVGKAYSCYGGCDGFGGTALGSACPLVSPPAEPATAAASATDNLPMIAGITAGGCVFFLAAAAAFFFFVYRRSKAAQTGAAPQRADSCSDLCDFSKSKPQQAASAQVCASTQV
jgi:hypothetical protein